MEALRNLLRIKPLESAITRQSVHETIARILLPLGDAKAIGDTEQPVYIIQTIRFMESARDVTQAAIIQLDQLTRFPRKIWVLEELKSVKRSLEAHLKLADQLPVMDATDRITFLKKCTFVCTINLEKVQNVIAAIRKKVVATRPKK